MTYPTSPEKEEQASPVAPDLSHPSPVLPPSPGPFSGRKGLIWGLVFGASLTLIGSRFLARPSASPTSSPASETATGNPTSAQTVTTERAVTTTIQTKLTTTGTVQAIDLLRITPQTSGLQIQEVRVRAGDRVATGQILAVLDDSVLRSQMQQAIANRAQAEAQVLQQEALKAQAVANLAEAEGNFQRYQALFEQGAISEEQLTSRQTQKVTQQEAVRVAIANIQSAQATVTSRAAEISRLQTQLEQTLVRSPANGIIATKNATIGDTSSTSDTLYELIQDDRLELAVQVPQSQLVQVVVGAPVQITAATDNRIQLEGSLQSIDPTVDAQTRQATLKISLPASEQLRSGMFLQANIVTGQSQGLTVPVEALLPQPDDTFKVLTLTADNTAQAHRVEVGSRLSATPQQPARIEILSGLSAGSEVIIAGASYLNEGDPVTVVEAISAP